MNNKVVYSPWHYNRNYKNNKSHTVTPVDKPIDKDIDYTFYELNMASLILTVLKELDL